MELREKKSLELYTGPNRSASVPTNKINLVQIKRDRTLRNLGSESKNSFQVYLYRRVLTTHIEDEEGSANEAGAQYSEVIEQVIQFVTANIQDLVTVRQAQSSF